MLAGAAATSSSITISSGATTSIAQSSAMAIGGCIIRPIAAPFPIGIQPWQIHSTRAGPAQAVVLAWVPARPALCVQVRVCLVPQLVLAWAVVLAWAPVRLTRFVLVVVEYPARPARECARPPHRSSGNSSRRVVQVWGLVLARPARECAPPPHRYSGDSSRRVVQVWGLILARPALFAAPVWDRAVVR